VTARLAFHGHPVSASAEDYLLQMTIPIHVLPRGDSGSPSCVTMESISARMDFLGPVNWIDV